MAWRACLLVGAADCQGEGSDAACQGKGGNPDMGRATSPELPAGRSVCSRGRRQASLHSTLSCASRGPDGGQGPVQCGTSA